MVWLPDGENFLKICLFVLTEFMNVMDGQTNATRRHRLCMHGIERQLLSKNFTTFI